MSVQQFVPPPPGPTAQRHVLMLHGAGAGGWEWNVWRRVFEAAGCRVAAPDLAARDAPAGAARTGAGDGPGPHGSDSALAATTLADYRAQALAAARALPAPPVLIGASLGALLAATVADAVGAAALLLVNPLPPAPFAAALPARAPWPPIVPWRREATLAATRRALPDADDATCLYAWRRWRDESGAVLEAAYAGVALERPACPVLMLASEADDDVPADLTARFAAAWRASLVRLPGTSHVGALLGRRAAAAAALALAWLDAAASEARS